MNQRAALVFLVAFAALFTGCAGTRATHTLGVLSFNLWHGGDAGGLGVDALAAVVRASGADIVAVQESHGFAPTDGASDGAADGANRPDRSLELAHALGFHHAAFPGRRAVLSRAPIVGATPGGGGVFVDTPQGRVAVHSVHFAAAPYQPYQLLGIAYFDAPFLDTAEQAVAAARATRAADAARVLADAAQLAPTVPVIVAGDFNEPSCFDWTERAVAAGHAPLAVDWPTTRAFVESGFSDAWRSVHPDETTHRGLTWTPTTALDDPLDRHDRIDFVFVRGARVVAARVVGEDAAFADVVVAPYPSDHRAVLAHIELPVVQ
jgi:endonuclease/exonuclease/phosphatase family metal-dependent hydrolase